MERVEIKVDRFDNLNQAIFELIKAIKLEEAALAHILSWEQELMQQMKNSASSLEEFVTANASVNNVLRNITKIQMMTQLKMHLVEELLLKLEDDQPNDFQEE